MPPAERGVWLKLSPARRIMIDMLHFAQRVPSIPVARAMNVAAVAQARALSGSAASWTAVFLRAYGLVCQRRAELRRALIPFPYPHLYEHPHSICVLAAERQWRDESVLLGAKIRSPETTPLQVLQRHISHIKTAPVEKISDFRQVLRLGRFPRFLRRFLIWQTLSLSGAKRAKRFGTFGLSSYGSLGAEQVHPRAIHTSLLTFGPISPAGDVVAKIVYDHRVLDGACVARCLKHLEDVLHTEVLSELRGLSSQAA
jgi:hypothetical protein